MFQIRNKFICISVYRERIYETNSSTHDALLSATVGSLYCNNSIKNKLMADVGVSSDSFS